MKEDFLENGAEVVSLFCRLYINTKKELPIRSSHMGLLIFTVKSQTPVTPIEAAKFFKVKKPMITAMVTSLEKNGYLEKQPSPTDGRSYRLLPTPKSITLVEETYNEYFRTMDTLYHGMGEKDYQQMIALLARANDILEQGRD
ncbi:MarR family winged helix-turn-helix transcriptional regulator [Allofournierella sp.]|uniref:MarR family winged helix-turn-helix transcriptional regulator n=1 Tax=Allofournierella sp. TaxID=1940256 RepID=UPI003AB15DCD